MSRKSHFRGASEDSRRFRSLCGSSGAICRARSASLGVACGEASGASGACGTEGAGGAAGAAGAAATAGAAGAAGAEGAEGAGASVAGGGGVEIDFGV